eukprot:Nitzschia sp. Nitz4//scaffold3_size479765//123077//123949//NITZ4_000053-RA/size479765-processed-gene-0.65-mRNA-1//1//CDS//3329550617//6618//frame0
MTIVYAVICRSRDAAILVELATEALDGSNAPQVTTALLEHLRDHPAALKEGDLKTFVHRNESGAFGGDDFFSQFMQACTVNITTTDELDLGAVQENYFHLWYNEGVFYCCLSDNPDPKEQKVYFAFLQAVNRDFVSTYTARRIRNCNAYAMDKDFKPTLRSTLDYYNLNRAKLSRDQKINALMAQIEDMKAVLGRNITLLLERETKIDRLVEKSERTRRDSLIFKKKSIRVKRELRQKSYKLWFLIAGLIATLILVVLLVGLKQKQ